MPDFSKGAIQDFIKGTSAYSTHREQLQGPPTAQGEASSSGFRSTDSNRNPLAVEDEFGSFASSSNATPFKERPYEPSWNRARDGDEVTDHQTRGSNEDGFEIQQLLMGNSGNASEEIDGDWERELLAEQRRTHDVDSRLPLDPLFSASSSTASTSAQTHLPGDLSPTSSELLSSLSSLDLSTMTYLKTLLSLPPEQAIQRYFDSTESTYTDDVWGLPKEVREVFERGKDTEAAGQEEETGREKAVRRLGMLVKHLNLHDPTISDALSGKQKTISDGSQAKGKGRATEAETRQSAAESARAEWAREWAEYPIAASHVRSPPKSHFENSLPSLSPPMTSAPPPISPYAHDPSPPPRVTSTASSSIRSQPISVPSSLSSEAFVVHGYSDHEEVGGGGVVPEERYPQGVYHEVQGKTFG